MSKKISKGKGVEYLQQLEKMHIIIKQMENEKKELESKIYNVKATDYSAVRVQTSNNTSSYTLVDKYIDETTDLDKEIAKYIENKNKIKKEIRQLSKPEYIDVLYKRYVEFKSPCIIAYETGYSKSNVFKIHDKAIKEFENMKSW